MGQCRRSMPGLDLKAEDDFNFPVILSARRYERYNMIIYGSRELGAWGRIGEYLSGSGKE